jgi:Tol biopolymer transport system component
MTRPSAEEFGGLPRVQRPRASLTGDYVAFFWNPGEQYELFLYDAEVEESRQLTNGTLHRSPNAPVVWAPSGDALFFQTGEHGYSLGEIHRLDLEGGIEQIATPGDGWGMLWGVDPTESWLLYTRADDGETQRVYRHGIETGDRLQLSGPDTTVPSRGVRISPDGTRVCYTGNATSDPGASSVYVVDADGGSPRRLSVSETAQIRRRLGILMEIVSYSMMKTKRKRGNSISIRTTYDGLGMAGRSPILPGRRFSRRTHISTTVRLAGALSYRLMGRSVTN